MPPTPLFLLVSSLLILASSSAASSVSAVDSESSSPPPGNGFGVGEWQILTSHNFSSQISLHPHILLLLSLPWSGEARSLMKEISGLVRGNEEGLGALKLMYMYRNKEKALAEAIVGEEENGRMVTVVYYRNSLPYKYRGGGALRARSILFSMLPYVSGGVGEEVGVPLWRMETREDVEEFLGSTDKGLVLVEVCGWTGKLVEGAGGKRNGSEDQLGLQGNFSGTSFSGESNRMPMSSRKEKQKGTESANFQCGAENRFSGNPWLGEFSSVNDISSLRDIVTEVAGNANSSVGESCSLEEFQKFDAFFSRFMAVSREFFLPPERHRFGLVTEKSLASSLGVGQSGSWSAMLYVNGCPTCSKILKEGDEIKSVLQNAKSIVRELEGDMQDLDLALPANKPSVLLFVDRSSASPETRIKGKEALDAFREQALHYKRSDQIRQPSDFESEGYRLQSFQKSMNKLGHPSLKFSAAAPKIKVKDKMSVVIVKEGKHAILDDVSPHLQGGSLHEILTQLLQQKGVARLSSVAKEVGFQLLSDDLNIKLADAVPSETDAEFKQVSSVPSKEIGVGGDQDSASCQDGICKTDDNLSSFKDSEMTIEVATNSDLIPIKADQVASELGLALEHHDVAQEKSSSHKDTLSEEHLEAQSFGGSFFFSDGNHFLLKALTSEMRIPSLVIIDSVSQRHYVFPAQTDFSHSSMADFLSQYLNGTLVPYQQSESENESPRENTSPPFVNLNFREADSVPRVTAHTFTEQVFGFNHSDKDNTANAWNEDVLVLFSNNWCGFCQRMELVVREVYRAIKGFTSMLKSRSMDGEAVFSEDKSKNAVQKIPKIFIMDCTLNDCSLILRSIDQREVYPALVLFPAERKRAVPYEGNIAVADVVRFIADHGAISRHLTSKKGILRNVAEKQGRKGDSLDDTAPTVIHEADTVLKGKSFEVLLKNRTPKTVIKHDPITSPTSKGVSETAPKVVAGSILIATEKLVVQPFDNSMIVIVKADETTGFQGLIYNKPIRWDALDQLEEGLESLKEAPLSLGGPLIKRGMPLLALTRRVVENHVSEVGPGIYFLDQLATLHKIEELKSGNQSIADYWFFLGFSTWGWHQLFDEINGGAWNLTENAGHFDWP